MEFTPPDSEEENLLHRSTLLNRLQIEYRDEFLTEEEPLSIDQKFPLQNRPKFIQFHHSKQASSEPTVASVAKNVYSRHASDKDLTATTIPRITYNQINNASPENLSPISSLHGSPSTKKVLTKVTTNHLLKLHSPSPKPDTLGTLSEVPQNKDPASQIGNTSTFMDKLLKYNVDRPMVVNRLQYLKLVHHQKGDPVKPSLRKEVDSYQQKIYTAPDDHVCASSKVVKFSENMIVIEYDLKKR